MKILRIASMLAIGASFLLLSTPIAASAVVEPPPSAATEDEATDADAMRFRESFGLRADPDFVRAARLDKVNYSSDAYGIPLSGLEVEELFRRARIQSAMGTSLDYARKQPGFGGAYLDQQNGGRPVFLFLALDPAVEANLAALLPEGADLQLALAKRTEDELAALRDQVVSDELGTTIGASQVVRVASDKRMNKVLIGVMGLNTETEKRLRDRYGTDVVIDEARIADSDARAGDSNNCRPIKGGLAINVSGGLPGQCTSGFVVKRTDTGTLSILTAGHCIAVHGGFDNPWYHNYDGFGRALYETWVSGGSGDADVGLTTIFSSDVALMTNKNHVRRNNTSNPASVTAIASPTTGGQACAVGVGSSPGHRCGQIIEDDEANVSKVTGYPSMNVLHTARVDFDSTNGDSGGPYFFYPGGGTCCSPITALGTHVHSEPDSSEVDEGWFSPISTAGRRTLISSREDRPTTSA
jgi:Trypsin